MVYLYIAHIVKLHGLPKEIISDGDSKFTSHFWRALCDIMGTKQGLSTTFHPQTDGQTERVNRVLEEMLRQYISADHTALPYKPSVPLVRDAVFFEFRYHGS